MSNVQKKVDTKKSSTLLLGLFGSTALILLFFSSRWLLAEQLLMDINATLSTRDSDFESVSETEWASTYDNVDRAISFNPLDNRFQLTKFRINETEFKSPLTFIQNFTTMDQYYEFKYGKAEAMVSAMRKSALLTPASPYSWVNLAFAKTSTSQYDEEFVLAFSNAMENGSQIDTIQRFLAQVSTSHPYALQDNPVLRNLMLENFENSLSDSGRSQQAVLNILRDGFMLPAICRELDLDSLTTNVQETCTTTLKIIEELQ